MNQPNTVLSQRIIFQTWWPLAASWLLMGLEMPILSAVVARLADPKIHLAAYGGVVFPLALIIESPVIMLLAASTALSKDWASYQKLNRFMQWAGGTLTALHVLIAFTPLYDWVVVPLFGPPSEIVEPARIGLMIMTPWTWSIAYRRFHQGVLIRFGQSRAVTLGTLSRLFSLVTVLGIGYVLAKASAGTITGIMVGTSAIAVAVITEALFVGVRVYPILKGALRQAPLLRPALAFSAFARFYTPLVMTSLLGLLVIPLGTAAMSRMPNPLDSLAIWPVLGGLLFLMVSFGIASNEVIVSLLEKPNALAPLRRFSQRLALASTALLVVMASTPLARLWFDTLSGLKPELAVLAAGSLWFSLVRPSLSVYQNWYQGVLIHHKKTRGITEAVVVFLVVAGGVLVQGVVWHRYEGVYVVQVAFSLGALAQAGWLWWRSQTVLRVKAAPLLFPDDDPSKNALT